MDASYFKDNIQTIQQKIESLRKLDKEIIDLMASCDDDEVEGRVTQRVVSVNYLFGRPLFPYNFLKIIFASNFRDMGNLRPGVFRLIKMSFRVPKKGQLRFSERK